MNGIKIKRKPSLWNPALAARDEWPDWYVWTGGWYESDGENNYYTSWDNLPENATVFDIGCYEGEWIHRMQKAYPSCQFHGFEPSPRAFKVARTRHAENDNVTIHSFGLGATTTRRLLYGHNQDGATFIHNDEHSCESVEAEIIDINEFMESEDIKCVHLAVINIEGMEFELLPHLISLNRIQQFKHLMIQWHRVIPDAFAIQQEIQAALAKTHSMMWNFGTWEAWRSRSLW